MAGKSKKAVKVTKMTTPELVKAVSVKSGQTQMAVKTVLDSFYEVARDCALNGKTLNMFGFGNMSFRQVNGKREREGITNPMTQERGILPATEPYTKPVFKFSKSMTDTIKENTKGRPFLAD